MKKVFSYIEQYQMIKPDDRVIVGLSGGVDSVGLLLLLKEYQTECQKKSPEKNSFLLEAVHVNHQIRGEFLFFQWSSCDAGIWRRKQRK